MGLLSAILKKNTGDPTPHKPAVVKTDTDERPKPMNKEENIVAKKIEVGYVHMSGCTGCLVSFADNYDKLFTILDRYVELCSCLALIDARHMDTMDIAIVEGSVCIQDKLSVDEIKETREKAGIVVALGGCACYGNITRFCRAASRTSRSSNRSFQSAT